MLKRDLGDCDKSPNMPRSLTGFSSIAAPEYWPDFIRIDNPAAGWSNPGDRATVVLKLLNRERALNMELEAFQKDACVTYVSRQRGYPMFAMNATSKPRAMGACTGSSSNLSRERVLWVSSTGRLPDDLSTRPCEGRCTTSIDCLTNEEPEPECRGLRVPVRTVRVLRLTTFKTSGVARLAHESASNDNAVDTRLPDRSTVSRYDGPRRFTGWTEVVRATRMGRIVSAATSR